jgi:hypothetical protein
MNFKKMKTGMALFNDAEKMQSKGFIKWLHPPIE